jgi:hypothetical protein
MDVRRCWIYLNAVFDTPPMNVNIRRDEVSEIAPNPSSRTPILDRSAAANRTAFVASPKKMNEIPKLQYEPQGYYICRCCPKNPRKFVMAEELR